MAVKFVSHVSLHAVFVQVLQQIVKLVLKDTLYKICMYVHHALKDAECVLQQLNVRIVLKDM